MIFNLDLTRCYTRRSNLQNQACPNIMSWSKLCWDGNTYWMTERFTLDCCLPLWLFKYLSWKSPQRVASIPRCKKLHFLPEIGRSCWSPLVWLEKFARGAILHPASTCFVTNWPSNSRLQYGMVRLLPTATKNCQPKLADPRQLHPSA